MLNRVINIGLASTALAAGVTLGTLLILDQLRDVDLPPLPKFVECWINPTEECPQSEISRLNKELRDMGQQLEQQDQAMNGQLVFEEGQSFDGSRVVVVGSLYLAPVTQTGFQRATCWVSEDRGGYDPRLAIAEMDANGVIKPVRMHAVDAFGLQVDKATIEDMRQACPWPSRN